MEPKLNLKINYPEMKKLALILCFVSVLIACATKEELNPELADKTAVKKALTPFERLQDSPTCVIPVRNFISINTTYSLANGYGIYGDLDVESDMGQFSTYYFFDSYVRAGDRDGNGNIVISFGEQNTIATGIYYTTSSSGYASEYDHKKYIAITIENYDTWNSTFPSLEVKPDQKVLVVVNPAKTEVRIKFCKAELDFANNNSGYITGEVVASLEH